MRLCRFLTGSFLLFFFIHAVGDEVRARQNYMLNCQGCHLPDGSGLGAVPGLKDFLGNFLKVAGGREFIVQVPGAANSPLTDEELAEVMNWILHTFSQAQLPENFTPYTAEEVGNLRRDAIINIESQREKLIKRINLE